MQYKKSHPDLGKDLYSWFPYEHLLTHASRDEKERGRQDQREVPRPHPCHLREVSHLQAPWHRQDQVSSNQQSQQFLSNQLSQLSIFLKSFLLLRLRELNSLCLSWWKIAFTLLWNCMLMITSRYLVPNDLTSYHFNYIIRKRIKLPEKESLYFFVNGKYLLKGGKYSQHSFLLLSYSPKLLWDL